MVVFNKIGHFEAIEIFSVEPFVMLWIDGGWPEKLVHFFFRAIAELGMETETGKSELAQPCRSRPGRSAVGVWDWAGKERKEADDRISKKEREK